MQNNFSNKIIEDFLKKVKEIPLSVLNEINKLKNTSFNSSQEEINSFVLFLKKLDNIPTNIFQKVWVFIISLFKKDKVNFIDMKTRFEERYVIISKLKYQIEKEIKNLRNLENEQKENLNLFLKIKEEVYNELNRLKISQELNSEINFYYNSTLESIQEKELQTEVGITNFKILIEQKEVILYNLEKFLKEIRNLIDLHLQLLISNGKLNSKVNELSRLIFLGEESIKNIKESEEEKCEKVLF